MHGRRANRRAERLESATRASDDEKLLAASARLGAAEFFDAFVPLTLEPSWRGPRPLLLTQRAGETVFVPEGFRHAVLNEELAVAVTHNVAPPSAVEQMLPLAADVCPAFAQRVEARRKKRRRGREGANCKKGVALNSLTAHAHACGRIAFLSPGWWRSSAFGLLPPQ